MLANPPTRTGDQGDHKCTEVPISLLKDLKTRKAYPVTIGGTSQRTFTLSASVTNPVSIWNGDDYIHLKNNVAYSWVVGTNTILDSTGAQTTLTNSTLGIWYMYLDKDGQNIYPSATAPSFVEGKFGSGNYEHPGTEKTEHLIYVGFMLCNATTPVFVAMTKYGHNYQAAATTWTQASDATWIVTTFTGADALPAHDGVAISGWLETGVVGTIHISPSSVASQGGAFASAVGLAGNTFMAPFSGVPLNAGQVYNIHTVAAGDIHISQVTDVV
jgi:hypothetical protein